MNPGDPTVLTITSNSCADPYVIHANGKYYLTHTGGNKVEIWRSDNLLDFERTCEKNKVWQPPGGRVFSSNIWAPELHAIQGRWYIYVSCSDPAKGGKSHRMYVLGGNAATEDPFKHQFKIVGPIRNMPDNWAIDGTVINLMGSMYMVYSSWPSAHDRRKYYTENQNVQEIHIVKLGAPDEAVSEPAVISRPTEKWEFSNSAGINEGPQWLAAPDGSWVGLVYSCAGSWTRDYKMATLHFSGTDPLDKKSWKKSKEPLIQSKDKPPFGPGHGCFIDVHGDSLGIFHGTDNASDGWKGRKARCQRLHWTSKGPQMGGYCGPLTDDVDVFKGVKKLPGHHKSAGSASGLLQKATDKFSQKVRSI